jgi:hypothetical protein
MAIIRRDTMADGIRIPKKSVFPVLSSTQEHRELLLTICCVLPAYPVLVEKLMECGVGVWFILVYFY